MKMGQWEREGSAGNRAVQGRGGGRGENVRVACDAAK